MASHTPVRTSPAPRCALVLLAALAAAASAGCRFPFTSTHSLSMIMARAAIEQITIGHITHPPRSISG